MFDKAFNTDKGAPDEPILSRSEGKSAALAWAVSCGLSLIAWGAGSVHAQGVPPAAAGFAQIPSGVASAGMPVPVPDRPVPPSQFGVVPMGGIQPAMPMPAIAGQPTSQFGNSYGMPPGMQQQPGAMPPSYGMPPVANGGAPMVEPTAVQRMNPSQIPLPSRMPPSNAGMPGFVPSKKPAVEYNFESETLKIPGGASVPLTIRTLAQIQRKEDIKGFEDKVLEAFSKEQAEVEVINPTPLPSLQMQPVVSQPRVPEKPKAPEFVVDQYSMEVLSIYGKENSLTAETLLDGKTYLLTIGDEIGPFVIQDIFSDRVLMQSKPGGQGKGDSSKAPQPKEARIGKKMEFEVKRTVSSDGKKG